MKLRGSEQETGAAWGIILGVLWVVGIVTVIGIGESLQKNSAAVSTTMFALSFTMFGAFVGFIFGIPRSIQADNSGSNYSQSAYGENTNLEQISDWLTKIIVGITLVQFDKIVGLFKDITRDFGPVLGEQGQVVSGSIGIYFLLIGFMFGYMWTRVHMAAQLLKGRNVANRLDAIERDITAVTLVANFLDEDEPQPAAEREMKEAVENASKGSRERIFRMAREARRNGVKSQDTKVFERVIPVFKALNSAEPNKYFRNYLQLGYALKDLKDPKNQEALEMLTQGINLRPKPVELRKQIPEMNRAVCRIRLDKEFDNNEPSKPEAKKMILLDIEAGTGAFKSGDPPEVIDWKAINSVD